MSEEYRLALDYCSALVAELSSTDQLGKKERAPLLIQIAFLERLERLVSVLEDIRDKPPASYTV